MTPTHKVQLLHTAVASHGICDGARSLSADIIVALSNNADETRMRGGDGGNKTKHKKNWKKNVRHNTAATHTHKVQ